MTGDAARAKTTAGRTSMLEDRFRRRISYLRLSVTDRCDLRCRYCMPEKMVFQPRRDMLTLDELGVIGEQFIARGIRKIRLTGGEPLARPGILGLARRIGSHIGRDLDELTITTNGTLLEACATELYAAGVRRINVSLDTLDRDHFRSITRFGDIERTFAGLRSARRAGLRIKINMVAMKGVNENEIVPMLRWCGGMGFDLTLIETMPLGAVDEAKQDRYLPLDQTRRIIENRFTLTPSDRRTGGPARYFSVKESGNILGFITPLTQNFCEGCNRIRISANGKLFPCLGQDEEIDLRSALREGGPTALDACLDAALAVKPLRHHFDFAASSQGGPARHMSVTGG